ncbi:siderophore-interacting protein [Sphingobium sp. SA2]|uniref:siderophore-interacting protein n=1 Tax=Sphingobium sp. SA2 TaxID=1524832 RepID=UPI0028C2B563|nr:siderophore-interacting protein [Sphingobium sp. SA2]MDT7532015.1 siderophore-interacting protein [Sphingobium sp. SA2]
MMHQRPVYRMFDTVVKRVEDITPRMRRVSLYGDDLEEFRSDRPGQWIKLFFCDSDSGRAFTIRQWDPASCELVVDFVRHGHGLAGRWVRDAQPGTSVRLAGPRSDFQHRPGSKLFLFGDETALPAISAIVEDLPATAWVMAVVEVADRCAIQQVASRASVRWHWIVNAQHEPGEPLADYVRNLTLGAESTQVWIACECNAARALRAEYRQMGSDKKSLHVSGYWKKGAAEHVDQESDY